MRYGVLLALFVLLGVPRTEAQSSLEYASLTGAVTAATEAQSGKKDKKSGLTGALAGVQEEGIGAMGRAGGLMGQVGAGMAPPEIKVAPPPPEPVSYQTATEASGPAPASDEPALPAGHIRVHLNDGRTIEGVLVERSKKSVRLETGGVEVTFFAEEISRVDE